PLADRLDEDVNDAAAGQADREGVILGYAVGLQHRLAALADLAGQLVDGSLHAAAGDAAHGLAVSGDGHRRAGLARRAAERAHHGGQAEDFPGIPPLGNRVQDVSHSVTSGLAVPSQVTFPAPRDAITPAQAGPGPASAPRIDSLS